MKLKKNEVASWNGEYKGVAIQVKNWKTEPNRFDPAGRDHWNYYLIIHLDRIPEENNPKSYWLKGKKSNGRVSYSYYNHEVLNILSWHGGITWYSKEHGFDGSNKVIKVGCDYSHLWDEGKTYDIEEVTKDAMKTVDDFLQHVPDYKYWCCGNGNFYKINEGVMKGDQFYSKEYWGDKDWFKKLDK